NDIMSSKQLLYLLIFMFFLLGCTPDPQPGRTSLPFFFSKAEELIGERRYGEALIILEEGAQTHPETVEPLILMGQIYLQQHRWLLAEDAFNRALARDLTQASATAGLAEAVLNQGRLDEALKFWQRAITLNPQLPDAHTGLGRTYLSLSDFEMAKTAFADQQTHQFSIEAAWYLAALTAPTDLATARSHLGDAEAALADEAQVSSQAETLRIRNDYLKTTLEPFTIDSSRLDVAHSTGVAFAQIEQWPLAINALSAAQAQAESVSIEPEQRAEILSFLGHALAQAQKPALDLFEQARILDPTSELPLYFEGLYLRQQGALNAAEALFIQATQLNPDNAAIYIELGRTKLQQGNLGEAEFWYQTGLEVSGNDLSFQVLLLQFYAGRGYQMETVGIPLAQEIIETEPNLAQVYDLLGWMYYLSGEPKQAEEQLQQALVIAPELVSARYHLARYLENQGQTTLASAEYQRVVDWDQSGVFRDEALRKLQEISE
ncbi:MAG: tetratricopeptide repeat protein, partial [Chloroflexota bacterium]